MLNTLKILFYLVLISGAIYRYFGYDLVLEKINGLLGKKSKVIAVQREEKVKYVVENEKVSDVIKNSKEPIIDIFSGDGSIIRENEFIIPKKEMTLASGDIIKVGLKSFLIVNYETARFKIFEDSHVIVESLGDGISLKLIRGQIFCNFDMDNGERFIVDTEIAEYSSKNGLFHIAHNKKMGRVAVLYGIVDVNAYDYKMEYQVKSRQGSAITSHGKEIKPDTYSWIQTYPWKKIAEGVVKLGEKKQDKKDSSDESMDPTAKSNRLMKVLSKEAGIDEINKQMIERIKKMESLEGN